MKGRPGNVPSHHPVLSPHPTAIAGLIFFYLVTLDACVHAHINGCTRACTLMGMALEQKRVLGPKPTHKLFFGFAQVFALPLFQPHSEVSVNTTLRSKVKHEHVDPTRLLNGITIQNILTEVEPSVNGHVCQLPLRFDNESYSTVRFKTAKLVGLQSPLDYSLYALCLICQYKYNQNSLHLDYFLTHPSGRWISLVDCPYPNPALQDKFKIKKYSEDVTQLYLWTVLQIRF